MSDSTAFLAGSAFAGIAALILLKGGIGNTSSPSIAQMPTVPVAPSAIQSPAPLPPTSTFSGYSDQQRLEVEYLRGQLEQQKLETEQLKAQLRNQQLLIENLSSQQHATLLPNQVRPGQVPPTPNAITGTPSIAGINEPQPNPGSSSGLLWALGGVVLTVTGGLVTAGMFAMLSRQQRPTRVVQVIHPNDMQPYFATRRRSEFLPPRLEGRRFEATDYDTYS